MDNEFFMALLPTWRSLSSAIDTLQAPAPELMLPADGADHHYWEKSTGTMFDPSLSSLCSSPASPTKASCGDGSLIRELIGKLGISGQFSGYLHNENGAPRLGQSIGVRSFSGRRNGQFAAMGMTMNRISSSPCINPLGPQFGDPNVRPNPTLMGRVELSNSQEDSSVSDPEKNPVPETNRRKRKAAYRGKEAEIEHHSGTKRAKPSDGGGDGNENCSVKTEEEARRESKENNANGRDENLQVKNESKPAEPPKDYIHVRARRGQATDSHSLAERVRREKISERMKILQDLVPGCSKVSGKALMLDEIINYVQSLQRQVEFLSMKLASVDTGIDTCANTSMAKDAFPSGGGSTDPHQMLPLDSTPTALYVHKNPATNISHGSNFPQYSVDPLNTSPILPYQAIGEDDLHSIVHHMGFR